MYISTLHPCLKLRSCGNVEEKFGIGAIFQDTEDGIREKRHNSDTSGPCSLIKLNVDSKNVCNAPLVMISL